MPAKNNTNPAKTPIFLMICVEGDFVRTCRTGEGEFGRKRENISPRANAGFFIDKIY